MDTILISATVAGFISLIGISVNIYIAKKSRDSARKLLVIKSLIDLKSEVLLAFKNYMIELEILKAEAYHLLKSIPDEDITPTNNNEDCKGLIENSTIVNKRLDSIIEKWAILKSELSEQEASEFQHYHHQIANRIHRISSSLFLIREITNSPSTQIDSKPRNLREDFTEVGEDAKEMLILIEECISNVKRVRRNKILDNV